MLAGPVAKDESWKYSKIPGGHAYSSQFGSVTVTEAPWQVEIRDATGKLLTKTDHATNNNTTYTPILAVFLRAPRVGLFA